VAIAQVQTQRGLVSDDTAVGATFDSPPTEGNLLIAHATTNATNEGVTAPAGWSAATVSDGAAQFDGGIYYKVAGASESSVVTFTKTGNSRIWRLHIFEYSGLATSDIVDVADNVFQGNTASNITTPTLNTATADVLLMALVRLGPIRTFSDSWTNSFTQQQIDSSSTNQESAHRIVSSTGSYDTNEAWTGGNSQARAFIAAFKAAAGGTAQLSGDLDAALQATETQTAELDALLGQVTQQGPLSPGTGTNDASFGNIAWSNPGNILASDDVPASAIVSGSDTTQYLRASNFGFTIPAGAVIDGIVVEIERRSESGTTEAKDIRVRIVKADGSIGATDKADVATVWPTTDTYASYGSAAELWGEAWSAADINDSDFGAVLAAQRHDIQGRPRVDHVRITVHYTPASAVTKTSNLDAALATRAAKTSSLNALLLQFAIRSHGLAAVLKVLGLTRGSATDAVLRATRTRAGSLDALVVARTLAQDGLDAVLRATETAGFAADALLRASSESQAALDARAVNRQMANPDADIAAGGWTADDGSTTDLYSHIDGGV
jgi:hypothetical protein